MREIVILVSLLMLSSGITGCLSNSEDEYVWPEPLEPIECEFSGEYELECDLYIQDSDISHYSITNPENGELWIIYLNGFVKSWNGEALSKVGDLSSIVSRCHMEQGLLGMAFDEDFINSRIVLISYVEEGGCIGPNESDLILASVLITEEGEIDISTITILREVKQPYRNHNGGHLLGIGDNRYLWGIGDGGSGDDPHENGQNSSNSLGTINLFSFQNNVISPVITDSDGDPYVLHYGLRNPWRFSMDNNGMLWIADVGQNCWEEINLASIAGQMNFGWSMKEGFQDFESNEGCNDNRADTVDNLTYPVSVYGHNNGNCSVTGGFWMDWGPEPLQGGYVYGDFCSGSIWILKESNNGWEGHYVGTSSGMIVGFGKGLGDELLIFHWTGEIILIR
tara:strand:+ start:1016 stop:2200 length:1185 start_codon:yes stop_codon:yes gene_type:complete